MALTRKQEQFIEEYLTCFNTTQAAIRAGYSPKSAYSVGWETLRKPEVERAISQRLSETAMTANEVMMRLAEQARGDVGNYLVGNGYSLEIDLAGMKRDKKTHLVKKITQTRRRRTTKDGEEERTSTTIELYSAQTALEMIGKHYKLFADNAGGSGEDGQADDWWQAANNDQTP